MSALREWAASCSPEAHQAVAVSSWGKWKTATQATPHHLHFDFAVLHANLVWLFLIRLCACRAVVLSGSSITASIELMHIVAAACILETDKRHMCMSCPGNCDTPMLPCTCHNQR